MRRGGFAKIVCELTVQKTDRVRAAHDKFCALREVKERAALLQNVNHCAVRQSLIAAAIKQAFEKPTARFLDDGGSCRTRGIFHKGHARFALRRAEFTGGSVQRNWSRRCSRLTPARCC